MLLFYSREKIRNRIKKNFGDFNIIPSFVLKIERVPLEEDVCIDFDFFISTFHSFVPIFFKNIMSVLLNEYN